MKSNYTILILGILSILIILIFVQISTAQPQNDDNEDSNWFDARDYYNRLDHSKDLMMRLKKMIRMMKIIVGGTREESTITIVNLTIL